MAMRVFASFKEVANQREGGLLASFPDERTVETTFARRPDQSFSFTFDKVFSRAAPDELRSHCAEPAALHIASGQHAVVYAYGHGGSGKSSTIFGPRDGSEQGLLVSVIDSLCALRQGPFAVTAVDIYKEVLRDLLAPRFNSAASLKLRDSAAGSSVEGATEIVIAEASELASRLPALRSQTRGHCVVTVRTPAGGKLYVVKLADSDTGGTSRQSSADAESIEARKWSLKSFTALGNCLKAVADRAKVMPVRESLLTRLQREALGASAHISLIGHCSVGDNMQEETVNTLRFVHRLRSQQSQQHPGASSAARARGSAGDTRGPDSSFDGGRDLRDGSAKGRESLAVMRGQEIPAPQVSAAKTTSIKAAQRKAALEAAVGVGSQGGRDAGSAPAGGSSFAGSSAAVQEELARAWEYAYQLENLVVWIAEMFQVGGYDPTKLEAMISACCSTLNTKAAGAGGPPKAIIEKLLEGHKEDVLSLPGGEHEMVNFRRNPVDSPWVGELHQVLLNRGVLHKMQTSATLLSTLLPASPPMANGKVSAGISGGGLGGAPLAAEGTSYEPPRVVSEDAKFLTLDSRIHELEHKSIATTDVLDAHIESLRKDVEDSLDHIDDELFANLVSRVSYLKMRREWALEAPSPNTNTRALIASATAGGKEVGSGIGKEDALQGAGERGGRSREEALRAGVEDAVALLEQTRAAAASSRQEGKKKKGQVAHVHWSEQNQVLEFQVPTPDKSLNDNERDDDDEEEELYEDTGDAEFSSASDEEVYAARLLNLLRSSLQTHERRHQSKVYGKCFSGVQLVDWLVETMDQDKLSYVTKVWNCSVSHLASGGQISRDQACIIAQGLMNAQVFAHLGSAADFTDDETLYRFLDGEEQALVLNRQILWTATARPACIVSQDLLKQAMAIAYSSGTRDYNAVQEFQQRTSELQMVNLIQLPVEELRCFFINIFNVLVLHARITSKAPTSEANILPRCSFFRNTSYQVGKYFYSLDDVCRGILRAKKCLFLDCDPRIHFALSYGISATPPARIFTHENLDRELEAATRRFCSERVRVDMANSEVTLPLLFDWYRKDFSTSPAGLLNWVAPRLPASVSTQLSTMAQQKEFKISFE